VHAVVVQATIKDFERARKGLTEETVPAVSQAPGFVAGYWTRSEDNRGVGMVVFESEEAAQAIAERIRSEGPPDPGAVSIDNIEVREVVAHA
jgi:hypothetical protein